MNYPQKKEKKNIRKLSAVLFSACFVLGFFVIPGFVGFGGFSFSEKESPVYSVTAMENMTTSITELITQIIPVFVIIGIFGVIIGMIMKMMRDFGK